MLEIELEPVIDRKDVGDDESGRNGANFFFLNTSLLYIKLKSYQSFE